ncbi:MAG: hypothetical protein Q9159_002671 [Coniocarpon cinnabarinum]
MAGSFDSWAKSQLAKLLPLDDGSLKQIIDQAQSLPTDAASENLKSLLGDSPQALEFISSFNQRRPGQKANVSNSNRTTQDALNHEGLSEVPRVTRKAKSKKQPLNNLPPPRQVEEQASSQRAYKKHEEGDYMPAKARPTRIAHTFALQDGPDAKQTPSPTRPSPSIDATNAPNAKSNHSLKLPPSAAGPLISDSRKSSRASSPAKSGANTPKTKINITGGASMHGASTTVSELDSAIRSLELQTDPTRTSMSGEETKRRRCDCGAQRHAILAAAPNCLSCGKIICAKEGLGPCTFCGTPILSSTEIHEMIRVLKEERGKEKQNEHNAAHRKADIAKAPRPFASSNNTPASSRPGSGYASDADGAAEKSLDIARAHRDRLLKYQAENARRTQIHDEAADYETPDVGLSMWASPLERAQQLKRQQKILREQEWNSKQDYEKRKTVMSIDIKGGKAVKRMQEISRDEALAGSESDEPDAPQTPPQESAHSGAGFARNPLLGELIRPVYNAGIDEKGKGRARERRTAWRRVQDDNDDNEEWILDGGAYGDNNVTVLSTEEPACG